MGLLQRFSCCRRHYAVAVALILVVDVALAAAFVQNDYQYSASRISSPNAMASANKHYKNSNSNSNRHLHSHSFESLEELDRARKRFELLFAAGADGPSSSHQTPHHQYHHHHHLMSSSARRRRLLEIELLQSLQDSDDAVEELVTLWMTERGPEQAQLLHAMQDHCSEGLGQEEAMLRQLQYYDKEEAAHESALVVGDDWLEASFRLALLLYYKGQSAESKSLCWHVLRHKPWHFEAAHLALLLAFREGRTQQVWMWAREQLPPLNPSKANARRHQWVKRAVTRAQESLEQAELELLHAQQQESLFLVPAPATTTAATTSSQHTPHAIAEENTFC